MDVGAGLVGLLAGLAVAPLADRVATNAPARAPLLRGVPRSPRLLLVAVGTAVLGAACGLAFGFTLEALVGAVFSWILVIVTRTDLEHRLIPDRVILPGTLLVLVGRTVDDPSAEWVLSAIGAGVALFLVVLVYPQGLGMGDAKLAGFLGAGLGVPVVAGMFIGFFVAFFPAAVLFVRHGTAARRKAIPLGPFLALGAAIALFAGDAILDWYVELGR